MTSIDLTVVSMSERTSVLLLGRLNQALEGISWEVVFVDDDSPDGTAAEIRSVALTDPRVRCLQRLGRRGPSSACIEGMASSSAPFLAVMDADLQHDESLLPTNASRAPQWGV